VVSLAKEPYKRDHILQKRPVVLKEPLYTLICIHCGGGRRSACTCHETQRAERHYKVATISRLLRNIGLFCRI